jgi:hypothetical protein
MLLFLTRSSEGFHNIFPISDPPYFMNNDLPLIKRQAEGSLKTRVRNFPAEWRSIMMA